MDDDPDARELISQFIQDIGAKPILCPSPTAALRIAEEEKPVVDIMTALKQSIERTKAQKKPMEKAKGEKKPTVEAAPAKQKKQKVA